MTWLSSCCRLGMGTKRRKRDRGAGFHVFRACLVVGGLFVAYVLSAGPVMRCWPAPVMSGGGLIGHLYSPIVRVWLGNGPGRQVFDWYFRDVWKVHLTSN